VGEKKAAGGKGRKLNFKQIFARRITRTKRTTTSKRRRREEEDETITTSKRKRRTKKNKNKNKKEERRTRKNNNNKKEDQGRRTKKKNKKEDLSPSRALRRCTRRRGASRESKGASMGNTWSMRPSSRSRYTSPLKSHT